MKKYIILFLSLILANNSHVLACSWYDPDEDYYNLFDQNLIADPSLSPFLLTYYSSYYEKPLEEGEVREVINYNIEEWKKFFDGKIVNADLNYLVYESTIGELSKILATNSFAKAPSELMHSEFLVEKGKAALEYLVFAKKCEQWATLNSSDDWTYSRKKMDKPAFMATAKEGNLLYAKTENKELKLRIAYQLVRLSHYGGFNDDAIRYFTTYVEPLGIKNLIYYYALEQKGGALFNQKKYAEAAYTFVKVFDNTPDRKVSSYNSFRIWNQLQFSDALKLCITPEEKAALYAMRGYHNFSNGLKEMENIYSVAPASAKIELLAVRELNKAERALMELGVNYGDTSSFLNPKTSLHSYLIKMIKFSEEAIKENKIKRVDFWKAYLAHLYFLNNQYAKAETLSKSIISTDKALIQQAKRTEFSSYLAGLNKIGIAEEDIIFSRFLKTTSTDERSFIYEVLGHKYLVQNDLAKAFLCHNNLSSLYANHDIKICNALIDFVSKKDKNSLENKLVKDQLGDEKSGSIALNDIKGTYYLFAGDYATALELFKKVPSDYSCLNNITRYNYNLASEETLDGFNGYGKISAKIFSNSVRFYFEDNEAKALTDLTFKDKAFYFITDQMNKQQLVESILQLQKLSVKKDEIGAMANYLLANYFFNITAAGYYRNIPYYEQGNYSIYSYYNNSGSDNPKPFEKLYNFNGFANRATLSFGYESAMNLYLKAEELSQNQEFKARSVFMASKCELETYHKKNEDLPYELSYWAKPWQLYSDTNRPMFARLKRYYSKTKFFTEAKTNCVYFKYYLNAR